MASTEAGVDGVTSMDTADDDVHRSDFNAGLQALLEAPRRGGGANNHTTLTAARLLASPHLAHGMNLM